MLFGPDTKPILTCEPVHSLSGRVRVECDALRYLEEDTAEIIDRI